MALPNIKLFLKNKKIVIFGVDEAAQQFVDKFYECMDIVYFTSNDASETEFYNLKRVELSDLISREDIYIVICASQVGTAEIENQLSICFKFCEQFLDCRCLEQVLEGKRELIVIEGLCHQELIAKGLELVPQIAERYIIKFFWMGSVNHNVALRKMKYMLCCYADAVIALDMGKAGKKLNLGRNIKIINIPLIYAQFLFPQIPCSQEMGITYLHNPYMMNSKKNIGDIRAFRYTDQNVLRLLKQGLSEEDVLYEISREDFYDENYINSVKETTAKINVVYDAKCEINLGTYLMEHYKEEKLFLDGMHWSNVFAWEAIRQIICLLDQKEVAIPNADIIAELTKKNAVWENEVPIYPSVRKHLEIDWVDDSTLYHMVRLKETKKLSFEEYMKVYIQYVYYSMRLQEIW